MADLANGTFIIPPCWDWMWPQVPSQHNCSGSYNQVTDFDTQVGPSFSIRARHAKRKGETGHSCDNDTKQESLALLESLSCASRPYFKHFTCINSFPSLTTILGGDTVMRPIFLRRKLRHRQVTSLAQSHPVRKGSS